MRATTPCSKLRYHCGQDCTDAACRYLEVRREMMKSPEGRKALLEGVPDVVIEVAELEHILQASASRSTFSMRIEYNI